MRNKVVPILALLLLTAMVAATNCKRETPPPSQPGSGRPATEPADDWLAATTQGDDWPAFQRGGPMCGVASPIAAPPMHVLWKYSVGRDAAPTAPAIAGRRVYVAADDGAVHCIDLATGRRVWAATFPDKPDFEATPLVAGGRVFIGDSAGAFHCLSADTGEELWKYEADSPIHSGANLTADGQVVFTAGNAVAGGAGQIVCLSPASSQPDWTVDIAPTMGAIAVSGGDGWVSSCDRAVRQIDLKTGNATNRLPLELESGSTPVVCGGMVLAGTFDGVLTCLDIASGEARWRFQPDEQTGRCTAPPACDGGVVVVTDHGGTVFGLSLATGERKWKFAAQDDVTAAPVISSGRVYFGSVDGRFYVLDLQAGTLLWKMETGKEIHWPAAVGRGVVVFSDSSGVVRCLRPGK